MSRHDARIFRQFLAFASLAALAAALFAWGFNPFPSPPWGTGPHLVVDGERVAGETPAVEDGTIFLPYSFLSDDLELPLHQETSQDRLVVIATTPHQVLRMATDELTAWLNLEELDLSLAPRMLDGTPYLPSRPLDRLYGLSVEHHPGTSTVTVDRRQQPVDSLLLREAVVLRDAPSRWAFRVEQLAAGDGLLVYEEVDGWYRARTVDGRPGYLPADVDAVHETLPVLGPEQPGERNGVREPPAHPINMTWDHVLPTRPAMSAHSDPPPQGLDVISPTWFHLEDGEGNLQNLARAVDMDWARAQGYHIWPLVTNAFNPDRTREMLHDHRHRERLIRQLLAFAELYGFDGINIDFENIYLADGPLLVQFVRELTPLARQQGLVVSIDVTFHSSSPNWSLVYDRPALAEAVDYVIVMAYDEYPGGSQVAGSTSSLPWVERGLERILAEVPAEKLLLGIPFYTRIWEVASPGSRNRVGVEARGMRGVRDLLAANQVTPTFDAEYGQYVAAFSQGNRHFRIWIEEENSLRARVRLAMEHGLAGIASWRRGFEQPEAWDWIREELGR